MTRVFQTRIKSRACENFGAVDYTITDTITESPEGLIVESRSRGYTEGEYSDQRWRKVFPGATLARAAEYRLMHGYVEITKGGPG